MTLSGADIAELLGGYGPTPVIASVGSHSALDISDGAVTEGLPTLVLAAQGRERTYAQYYRTHRDPSGQVVRGCVDEVWTYPKFADLAAPAVQQKLRDRSALLVPNRALSSYVPLATIENDLRVPIVGSRAMLRIEERTERENYYTLLAKAGIPTPAPIAHPSEIDGLAMVKLPHAKRRLERGFFTAATRAEYDRKSAELVAGGTITRTDLANARIERYVIGPVFNFNFFFSPLVPRDDGLELLGVDERRESSLDGLVRLPAAQQLELPTTTQTPDYTVVGHGTLTVRESILEAVFDLGERFVEAAREHYAPGILGPFCLQTCIDPEGKPWVFDVAVRIGGGTNIHLGIGHPYGNALWRTPMSSGRRVAVEIRRALALGRLREIVT
ncbi:MAG: formate--phosphoribosylaminoimidazolecarboxamide ligase family protein [Thermoplasmata archaeon]|nr:formate--phosphoribosylaminoimidazolecarboxamide ligase family protein [Thermoplasmata archaeon]